jgi:hypothetical protein
MVTDLAFSFARERTRSQVQYRALGLQVFLKSHPLPLVLLISHALYRSDKHAQNLMDTMMIMLPVPRVDTQPSLGANLMVSMMTMLPVPQIDAQRLRWRPDQIGSLTPQTFLAPPRFGGQVRTSQL